MINQLHTNILYTDSFKQIKSKKKQRHTEIDFTEGTAADFSAEFELATDDPIHAGLDRLKNQNMKDEANVFFFLIW